MTQGAWKRLCLQWACRRPLQGLCVAILILYQRGASPSATHTSSGWVRRTAVRSGASPPDLLSLLGVQLPVIENPGDSGFEGKFTFPSWRLAGDGLRLLDTLGAGTLDPWPPSPSRHPQRGDRGRGVAQAGEVLLLGTGSRSQPLVPFTTSGQSFCHLSGSRSALWTRLCQCPHFLPFSVTADLILQ